MLTLKIQGAKIQKVSDIQNTNFEKKIKQKQIILIRVSLFAFRPVRFLKSDRFGNIKTQNRLKNEKISNFAGFQDAII